MYIINTYIYNKYITNIYNKYVNMSMYATNKN